MSRKVFSVSRVQSEEIDARDAVNARDLSSDEALTEYQFPGTSMPELVASFWSKLLPKFVSSNLQNST